MAVAVARNREAQKSLPGNPRRVQQVAGGEGRDVAMARSRARRQDPGQLAQRTDGEAGGDQDMASHDTDP